MASSEHLHRLPERKIALAQFHGSSASSMLLANPTLHCSAPAALCVVGGGLIGRKQLIKPPPTRVVSRSGEPFRKRRFVSSIEDAREQQYGSGHILHLAIVQLTFSSASARSAA